MSTDDVTRADTPMPGEGSRPRPSPLRLSGFLVTITGGTMIGIGSLLTWATVRFGGDSDVRGIDVWTGKVALGCAILVLIGIPALRGALTIRGRTAWAVIMIAAALLAGSLALWTLIDKDDLLGLPGAESAFDRNEAGLPDEALDDVLANNPVVVDPGIGLYLTIAGGVVGAIGGGLGLAWARSTPVPKEPDAPEGAEPDRPI